jgi:hypothetical protein
MHLNTVAMSAGSISNSFYESMPKTTDFNRLSEITLKTSVLYEKIYFFRLSRL